MKSSLHGFAIGEHVLAYDGHGHAEPAIVAGPAEGGQVEIRYAGQSTVFVCAATALLHDTPAAAAFVAAANAPGAGLPGTMAWYHLRDALRDLHRDNRHLQPNIA